MRRAGHGALEARATDNERYRKLTSGAVTQLRGMVDDLVHRQGQKVHDLKLDDRPCPNERRAYREPCKARLTDGSVDHSLVAKLLLKALCYATDPAHRSSDVLADYENGRVAEHFLAQGFVERLRNVKYAGPSVRCDGLSLRRLNGHAYTP